MNADQLVQRLLEDGPEDFARGIITDFVQPAMVVAYDFGDASGNVERSMHARHDMPNTDPESAAQAVIRAGIVHMREVESPHRFEYLKTPFSKTDDGVFIGDMQPLIYFEGYSPEEQRKIADIVDGYLVTHI